MKNANVFALALLLPLLIFISNCSPDQYIKPSTEDLLTRNGWSVDYYFQQQDITGEFGSYRITFNPSGTIFCRNENEIISGSWNRIVDAGGQKEIISISINSTNPSINKLNDSWTLVSLTASTISFEDGQFPSNSVLRIRIKQ